MIKIENVDVHTDDYISKNYHKIGHIDKFAEALKELEEMAKSGGN